MSCLVPKSKLNLFKPSDNYEAKYWRSYCHKCYNNAIMDMPKGNPVVNERYFCLETESKASTKTLEKKVFFKINSSLGPFLLHYIGDKNHML